MKKTIFLLVGLLLLIVFGIKTYINRSPSLPLLPVSAEILVPELQVSQFKLSVLTLGGLGGVYGAYGGELHHIVDNGSRTEIVHTFGHKISAIHEREDGLMIVATDDDHWDTKKPCRIYRSIDGGKTFILVKVIEESSVLWWSIDSNSKGFIYLSEYGPQRKGLSKTLWRSIDDGEHWEVIYQARNKDKTHLHRIAVDPYTDDVWMTIGDGSKNRAMLRSVDDGDHWEQVDKLQATAVAFGPEAIYWGRDRKSDPGVLRYDRKSQKFEAYFEALEFGNYGGSVYDMVRLKSGELIVPFMKYPKQSHVAAVWRGKEGNWTRILDIASEQGKGAGAETIAGPDKDGWVYFSGYQLNVQ